MVVPPGTLPSTVEHYLVVRAWGLPLITACREWGQVQAKEEVWQLRCAANGLNTLPGVVAEVSMVRCC